MKKMVVKLEIEIDLDSAGWPSHEIQLAKKSLLNSKSFKDLEDSSVFEYDDSIKNVEVQIL